MCAAPWPATRPCWARTGTPARPTGVRRGRHARTVPFGSALRAYGLTCPGRVPFCGWLISLAASGVSISLSRGRTRLRPVKWPALSRHLRSTAAPTGLRLRLAPRQVLGGGRAERRGGRLGRGVRLLERRGGGGRARPAPAGCARGAARPARRRAGQAPPPHRDALQHGDAGDGWPLLRRRGCPATPLQRRAPVSTRETRRVGPFVTERRTPWCSAVP